MAARQSGSRGDAPQRGRKIAFLRRIVSPGEADGATAPSEHAGSGAFLGGVLGGVLGWLIGVGAFPHPAFLPLDAGQPLVLALVLASFGVIVGGVTGVIADLTAPARQPNTAAPGSTDDKAPGMAGEADTTAADSPADGFS